MADTSQQQPLSEPHTNGVMDGLTEEEKSKMRPADIDADMREMERRKRVEMMMNSRLFREELERIIETQMKDGAGPSGLLQQISDMMGAQGARFNGNIFKNSNCVLPINDIRGVESMGYAKGEKLLRCKLAAVFRLLDLYGWTQGVGGQITARLNQDQEHFLVNPYGLLYHEVTASSLIKVDMQGTIVEQGTTNFGVHVAGFQLHSTIHAARPDIKCIVHITTPSVTAISSLKCGLLPIGQESIVIGEVSTHQYIGGFFEPEEKEKIARNLGPMNKIMLLTNRGALCCGETVEEAFFNVYNMVLACETQLKLMPAGLDNLNLISEESKKAIFEASRKPPTPQQTVPISETTALTEKLEKRWRIGGTEFEALMRMLDNAGFRTGYIYRNPLVKGEPPRPRNDVEVPPAVSSLGYLLEEEELYKQGLWKGGRKGTDRSRWLNSPNVYQKVEILETGTPDPKKITKWVSDGSPTHSSTPVKIDSALQFVPKNTNPKEFKQIQQQIKDYRRADKISAGPQSHILEGVTWEEAKKMQDATISGTGEQVVLVGAASKGIIQRGFQHNAMVYKTPYAKNPFDAITDQELDQYKREVERKQKGDIYDESQSESEALSSFNVSRATHESSTAKSPIQSPVSVTSETEEESRDEPRVLRIETKQVPAPSQPEVVLSDDPDSSSRYYSHNEYKNKIENEVCVVRKRDYSVAELYRCEPRLEIVRSDIIAKRLVTTLIEYYPRPPIISIDEEVNYSIGTKYNDLEQVSNLVYLEDKKMPKELYNKKKPKVCRSLKWKNNENLLDFCDKNSDVLGKNRDAKTNLKSIDTSSVERIAEMVNCIRSNVSPSKTRLSALSRSGLKISTKYSLDPTDMSLIYSLTPFINSDDHEHSSNKMLDEWLRLSPFILKNDNDLKQNCFSRSSKEKNFKNEQWNNEDCLDDKSDNYIWSDFDGERYESSNGICPEIMNNDLYFDNGHLENRSNESLDTLDLPEVRELIETTDEFFQNGISDSANEIIAELNVNDTYVTIYYLLNEIFEKVYDILSDVNEQYRSLSSSVSEHLSTSTSCLSVKNNDYEKENEKYQSNQNASIVVVHEIIHHVIDMYDEFKNVKANKNVDLKEIENCYTMNHEDGQQINNLITSNNDELEKASFRNEQTALIASANLIEINEKNNESLETAEEADELMEADAIFEFHTIVKKKQTNINDKAFELNFRVEKNHNIENIIENKISRKHDIEDNKVENLFILPSNTTVSPTNIINIEQDRNSNNSLENDKRKRLHITDVSDPIDTCIDCIHCMKFYTVNYDQECPSLISINEEESNEEITNLNYDRFNDINDNTDIQEENQHNDLTNDI
ncbi:interaptin isoform X1 [Apis dorsata]|uniref:interaptin isoform X1 n=1 Tax=Apis dorsata TaxID=7462 RepID=UPI00129416C5|nr:interaptin isoform X1 [Apis dorsata]